MKLAPEKYILENFQTEVWNKKSIYCSFFDSHYVVKEKSDLYCFAPPPLQEFLCPSITIYALLYSTLLCKNSTCTWRGRRIDPKSHHLGKEKRTR